MSPKSDLASFSEGTGYLLRRPLVTLGLLALGTALGALPPFLQIRAALPDSAVTNMALGFVSIFPLTMYFIPRFLAEADAAAGDRPLNPAPEWERRFDERWLRSMAGRLLLYAGVLVGSILILPGLIILVAFGWAPTRILLRGESLAEAARGSLRMTALAWRRILGLGLALLAAYLAGELLILLFIERTMGLEPAPWARLTRPAMWFANLVSVLLEVWVSAVLVAIFRRVEGAAAGKQSIND